MKKFVKVLILMVSNIHPIRQIGILAVAGALIGLWMAESIPEFCDGMGLLAVAVLACVGLTCVEFAEFIIPTEPDTK